MHDELEGSSADSTATAPTLRVLIADDNEDAADMLATLLGMKGHEVCVAHDGLEAVTSAIEFHPDVALLDIGMPQLNGHEVAAQIREQLGHESVMLVAITGWGQDRAAQDVRRSGFDHHLVKPIDFEQLSACLSEQQRQKQARATSA